jgi:hypothetical protein
LVKVVTALVEVEPVDAPQQIILLHMQLVAGVDQVAVPAAIPQQLGVVLGMVVPLQQA